MLLSDIKRLRQELAIYQPMRFCVIRYCFCRNNFL